MKSTASQNSSNVAKTPSLKRKADESSLIANPFDQILKNSAFKSSKKDDKIHSLDAKGIFDIAEAIPSTNHSPPLIEKDSDQIINPNSSKKLLMDRIKKLEEMNNDLQSENYSLRHSIDQTDFKLYPSESSVVDQLGETTKEISRNNFNSVNLFPPNHKRYSLGISRYSTSPLPKAEKTSSNTIIENSTNEFKLISTKRQSNIDSSKADSKIKHSYSHSHSKKNFKNFIEFVVLGMEKEIIQGKELDPPSSLSRNLNTHIEDIFPARDKPSISSISEFCFPHGPSLKILPLDVALLKCQSQCDKSHILQFSDANGTPKFAYCLIITECYDFPNESSKQNLLKLQLMIKSSNIIKRNIKNRLTFIKAYNELVKFQQETLSLKTPSKKKAQILTTTAKTPTTAGAGTNKKTFMSRVKHTLSWKKLPRHDDDDEFNSKTAAAGGAAGSKISSLRRISGGLVCGSEMPLFGFSDDEENSSSDSENESKAETKKLSHGGDPSTSSSSSFIVDSIYDIAGSDPRTSHQEKELRSKSEEDPSRLVIVGEKAFCAVSDTANHSFLSQLVTHIAHKERIKIGSHIDLQAYETSIELSKPSRHRFLSLMQKYSTKEDLNNKRINSHHHHHHNQHHSNLTNYLKLNNFYPQTCTLSDWTGLLMYSCFSSELLTHLIQLLLLERSIIVIGQNTGMVTAVCTGLISLLQPFKWEGVFVPLIPPTARDILQAPVPYVVGTTYIYPQEQEELCGSVTILKLGPLFGSCIIPLLNNMKCSQSTTNGERNLSSKSGHFSSEDVNMFYMANLECNHRSFHASLFSDVKLEINNFQMNLASSDLHLNNYQLFDFIALFSNKIPPNKFNENYLSILKKIKVLSKFISSKISKFCGNILDRINGWRNYSVFNSSSNEFEFVPALFLEPLQQEFELRKQLCHTQLFVSFIDNLRVHEEKAERAGRFIRDWLSFKWQYINASKYGLNLLRCTLGRNQSLPYKMQNAILHKNLE